MALGNWVSHSTRGLTKDWSMAVAWRSLLAPLVFISVLKLLLVPAYTDFEVHRNWLALTHSLPIHQWYLDITSQWTLDYPPFFAWFEWLLSYAVLFDPQMVRIQALEYASPRTILFQRLSVVVLDLVFFFAVVKFCEECHGSPTMQDVHFQYNGLILGVFVWTCYAMARGDWLLGGILFSVCLNLKHINLYYAPVVFVFLLSGYCIPYLAHKGRRTIRWATFISLGISVVTIFGLSLGPFIMMNQLPQLLSRLFPFQRGLTHAYWAPNAWALYNAADLLLARVVGAKGRSGTSGLVGDVTHVVLPSVPPAVALGLTVMSLLPLLYRVWRKPDPQLFVPYAALSALCFFLFGFHVHEKAVLMATVPLSLVAAPYTAISRPIFVLNTVGTYALFPLLFQPAEIPLKVTLFVTHTLVSYFIYGRDTIAAYDVAYLLGLVPLFVFAEIVHPALLAPKMAFLPLMLTSIYCAIGVVYSWVLLYVACWRETFAQVKI